MDPPSPAVGDASRREPREDEPRGTGKVVTRRNLPATPRRSQRLHRPAASRRSPARLSSQVESSPLSDPRQGSCMPEPSNPEIVFDSGAGVATVTLNRPDVLNSFTRPMARALRAALDRIRDDRAIRAVVLTGAGRAFCAGQDLAEATPQNGVAADLGAIVRGATTRSSAPFANWKNPSSPPSTALPQAPGRTSPSPATSSSRPPPRRSCSRSRASASFRTAVERSFFRAL